MTSQIEIAAGNFEAARRTYIEHANRWEDLALQLRARKERLWQAARDVDVREAELRLDPLLPLGKNAEERQAQLTITRATDGGWKALQGEADKAKLRIQAVEDEMQACERQISLAKRIMDFEAALLRRGGQDD